MQYESENPLSGVTRGFFPESPGEVWRTWWKISPRHYGYGKAVLRQVDLKLDGRLLLDTEEGCTWRQIPTKVIRLNILEESFCLFHEHVKYYIAYLHSAIFETLPDRKILYTYLNSALKVQLSSSIEFRGTKIEVKFYWPVLFFYQVFFIINKLFRPLLETLYTGPVKLFPEAPELFTHPEFQLIISRKTASSECILHRAKNIEVIGSYIKTVGRMTETIVLFGRKLRMHCFDFSKFCTYHSDLFVAPLSKTSTSKISSPTQKRLALTLLQKPASWICYTSSSVEFRFSALRLLSFWPPEVCTPRTPFSEHDLKHGVHEELRRFSKEFYVTDTQLLTQTWENALVIKKIIVTL